MLSVTAPCLIVAISALVRSGCEAKNLIAPPLARRCARRGLPTGFLSYPSTTPHPQQQLDRNVGGQSRHPMSSTLARPASRRPPAWAQRSGISSFSSIAAQPSSCHRRLSLFEPDSRLWLTPRHHREHPTMTARRGAHGRSRGTDEIPLSALRGGSTGGGGTGGIGDSSRLGAQSSTKTTRMSTTTAAAGIEAGGGGTPQAAVEVAGESGERVIVKPDRDEREYRYLVLPNGLSVVLVSDTHTETAAASMFIRCGHMQDPPELPGMAHFHEHSELMLVIVRCFFVLKVLGNGKKNAARLQVCKYVLSIYEQPRSKDE